MLFFFYEQAQSDEDDEAGESMPMNLQRDGGKYMEEFFEQVIVIAVLRFNQSIIKTHDAQASFGYPSRCLRCDGRPSMPVLCNARQ